MPCRSDYMEPSTQEQKAWTVWREDAQKVADALVYSSDVLREHILEGNFDTFTRTEIPHIGQSERYREEVKVLQARFKNLYMPPALYDSYNNRLTLLLNDYIGLDVIVVSGAKVGKSILADITNDQIKHREDDLRRLMKTFADSGDRVRLKKVLDADNTKPLEPQLGFSPDDF